MKKATLINAPISNVVALMGHTDRICIGDAGLPIPVSAERIDLAVRKGLPKFLDVFETVTSELCVERVTLANELKDQQPGFHKQVIIAIQRLASEQGNSIEIDYVPHSTFKSETHSCKAVIRSGECTPYANIILSAGVTFP